MYPKSAQCIIPKLITKMNYTQNKKNQTTRTPRLRPLLERRIPGYKKRKVGNTWEQMQDQQSKAPASALSFLKTDSYSIFLVSLYRLTHSTWSNDRSQLTYVKWPACQHLFDLSSINSIRRVKIKIYFSYQNWKNYANTSNSVILSIYIHNQSHTIQRMSSLPSINTDKKLDMID